MISFIKSGYRQPFSSGESQKMRPGMIALVLGAILLAQIVLVFWIYFKNG